MPIITEISPQKKNPNRFSIFIDNNFWSGVSKDVLERLLIKEGQQITNQEKEELSKQLAQEYSLQIALKFLGSRSRSVNEIKNKLSEYDIDSEVIELTINLLDELMLVNDELLIQQVVESYKSQLKGEYAIYKFLYKLQVNKDLTKEIIEANYNYSQQLEKAELFYNQYCLNLEKQKIYNKLLNRGFNYDIVNSVLENHED